MAKGWEMCWSSWRKLDWENGDKGQKRKLRFRTQEVGATLGQPGA